jgi:hypothetical protein
MTDAPFDDLAGPMRGYHGTVAQLAPGDLIHPSIPNYQSDHLADTDCAYFFDAEADNNALEHAITYACAAAVRQHGGRPVVYEVEPTGPTADDLDVAALRESFGLTGVAAVATPAPLVVVGKVWEAESYGDAGYLPVFGFSPKALQWAKTIPGLLEALEGIQNDLAARPT